MGFLHYDSLGPVLYNEIPFYFLWARSKYHKIHPVKTLTEFIFISIPFIVVAVSVV